MIPGAQFRVLAIGAVLALTMGGAAQARSHGRNSGRQISHSGVMGFAERHAGSHRGTEISFHSFRHERLASRDFGRFGRFRHGASHAYESGHSGGGIQCVTFARADSGIELSGNASSWWYNAAGVYQRGSRPEAGSVLNFRANGSMRMGHVAVVNQVVNDRTIEIDHANWGGPGAVPGGISRDISVVDVSPGNDWSAVRVALGHSGEYGSIYPTYGFIYNRPDAGTMVAANDRATPMPSLNPAPRDLRGSARADQAYDEVAEAPDSAEPVSNGHYSRRRSHYGARPVSYRHGLLATTSHNRRHRRN